MTTYSTSLKLSLIADGDQAGTWGQTTNNNLGTLLEQAITGVVSITMLDANYTLTNLNGVSDEARNAVLVVGGANTGVRDVIAPAVEKLYIVKNQTTGNNAIRIKTAAGAAVTIPNGVVMGVFCDGTDFYTSLNGTAGGFSVGSTLAVAGATTLSAALSGTTASFSGAISSVSPSFTGTPTVPTAAGGTSTTQAASTAFVQNALGGLGSMSTQNANNVNITGGSITGITDLAIADGGTGASTASDARNNLGLGSMALQNSNSISVTGGTITGITDLAIADGGTGSSTAAGARANLSVPSTTGSGASGTWAIDISGSAAGLSTIVPISLGGTGASSTATARTNLGLGALAILSTINNSNWSGTALAIANGGTGASDVGTARTNLGLGSMSTQNSNSVNITGGSITGITDLAIADGGTGASTAANARTNLGLGTMSTQDSNNVSITGGSISGITALAVANGGTGASTFTANNVLLGNGASTFQAVAPGTSGNVLTSNGTTWTSAAPFGWNVSYINTSVVSGNAYTLPANCIGIFVWCTIPGSGNNGGIGRAQVRNASNVVLGTLYINGTNVGGGADGGSGMTDGAGSFLPISSTASNVLFDVVNNAVSGTFTVQAYITK